MHAAELKTSALPRTIAFEHGWLKIEDIVDIAEGSARVALSEAAAFHVGIKRGADLAQVVATAEAAGFLVVHVGEQLVRLTSKGREAARG